MTMTVVVPRRVGGGPSRHIADECAAQGKCRLGSEKQNPSTYFRSWPSLANAMRSFTLPRSA